jgi:hypothetical protein
MAMITCRECGASISDQAAACPRCGAAGPRAPMMGYELRIPLEGDGLPLIHIATGIDPRTGRKRIAKGVIAIGDVAVGGIAIGGVSLGVVSLGGMSFGIVSLGGLSIAALFALGGLAIGGIAIGGAAVGYYAMGGGAFGAHTWSGMGQDPEAVRFFNQWIRR